MILVLAFLNLKRMSICQATIRIAVAVLVEVNRQRPTSQLSRPREKRICNHDKTYDRGEKLVVKKLMLLVALSVFLQSTAFSQTGLDNCTEQFIDGKVSNAPTLFNSRPDEPFGSNKHLCYRDDGVSFFAIEYRPDEFTPRWAAYRLTPGNYGINGCSTFTRNIANCYFQKKTWAEYLNCTKSNDPFHTDYMLDDSRLGSKDFTNTGHDRGHIAPRQAFSWHVCGTYQTFSMANMSPQRAFLNQDIWMYLEKQILTWGIDEGPIYVVSGTTFRAFPHHNFEVYTDNTLDPAEIYKNPIKMQNAVEKHHSYFETKTKTDILRPKRNAKPDKIKNKVKDMRMPTGYFKVIYRPPANGEPAHAIGFLLPHTFENLNMLADNYNNMKKERAFWAFVSRIDLIEKTGGIRFPGIPQELKSVWGDDWFLSRDQSRNKFRADSCNRGNPQGVLANSTKAERIEACIDKLNE